MDLYSSGTRTADTRSQSWMVTDPGVMRWPGVLLIRVSWHPVVTTVSSDCKSLAHGEHIYV